MDEDKTFKAVAVAGALLFLAVLLGAGYFIFGFGINLPAPAPSPGKTVQSATVATSPIRILPEKPAGEIQKVELTASGLTYLPYPVELKVGVPVELSISPKVSSCLATMVASSLGLRVSSREGPAYFIPEKAGEYQFTCWMNMGRGKFVFVSE
ncbi:MAG: cupredoxin domain-containing protein [archaeon]